jgi:hypothetical protein
MLIGAPQEMNRSEACFSAISDNRRDTWGLLVNAPASSALPARVQSPRLPGAS